MEWLLILTLVGSGGSNGQQNPALATAAFHNERACVAAAKAWVARMPKTWFKNAVCVRTA